VCVCVCVCVCVLCVCVCMSVYLHPLVKDLLGGSVHLLLHRYYTIVTLLLHCCYTVVFLLLHCCTVTWWEIRISITIALRYEYSAYQKTR
jgi:hypothetical protein